ncbi:LADA_0E01288g1_1 [Lachancea dasiensis]|uniref:LADA_0E01288g1_1 n=1 Tax=Lachancea dasiensis TaxID=1072105 RepID=A0A1G4JAD7_9SACH|nr:LADA_0E01288g1_1 [Lachancea dasiensis]
MDNGTSAEALKKAAPKLPLSKVKRIAKVDPDYTITSQSAVAAVAFATELFVQVLTEEGLARSQLEKPSGSRLSLRYDNIAAVVSSSDRFEFLSDVIPETQNLVTLTRENRVRYTAVAPGQSMLPFRAREEATEVDDGDAPEDDLADAAVAPDYDGDQQGWEDLPEHERLQLRSNAEIDLKPEPESEPEPEPESENEPEPDGEDTAEVGVEAIETDAEE